MSGTSIVTITESQPINVTMAYSSGTSGTSGSSNSSGTSGTSSTSGSSGSSGSSGVSGTSGTSGTSGSSGSSGSSGVSGSSGYSQGQVYYFHHDGADVVTYEGLLVDPANSPEDDEAVTCTLADTEYLVDAYITLAGNPGITSFPVGQWLFHCYHYVNNIAGVVKAVYRVYKRTSGGVETELFNVESEEINALSAQEYLTDYIVSSSESLDATDRLVVKVYVKSTVAGRIVHFVYEGSTRVSYIITPLGAFAGSSGTSGTSGTSGSSGTSGPAGSSGSSGTSGPAGSSGTSGSSLPVGTDGQMIYSSNGNWTAFSKVFWDDDNNRLGISATSAPQATVDILNKFHVLETTASIPVTMLGGTNADIVVTSVLGYTAWADTSVAFRGYTYSNSATAAPGVRFYRYGGTKAAKAAVPIDSVIGTINFYGWDTSALRLSAYIRAIAESAFSYDSEEDISATPMRLSFATGLYAGDLYERFRITAAGEIQFPYRGSATAYTSIETTVNGTMILRSVGAVSNYCFNTTSYGSFAQGLLCIGALSGYPLSRPADIIQFGAYDESPGNCCPIFFTEGGDIIILFEGAALTSQLTTLTHTAPGTPDYAIQDLTNSSGYGFATKDEGNTVLAVIANLQARVAELEARLQAHGLLA